jgi:hypothetical protein
LGDIIPEIRFSRGRQALPLGKSQIQSGDWPSHRPIQQTWPEIYSQKTLVAAIRDNFAVHGTGHSPPEWGE